MRRGVGTGLVVAIVTSALLLNLAVSAKTLPPTAFDKRLAGGSDDDVEATTDVGGDADVDVGQCSSSGGGSLDEVERALEERMARSAFYNAGQGEPNLPAVLAHDRLRGADVAVGEKEEEDDEGLCRQGDFNSTVVCD